MTWYKHRDPLHYCVPGPINFWDEVLFNWIARGHLCDFSAWSSRFSKGIGHLGGLRNANGTSYGKERNDTSYAKERVDGTSYAKERRAD
uniref:Uncharacterized protein n=1 Tax=Alexandrium catenella TaxID=2925 RepID=A0A6T9L0B0_ALECA